MMERQQYITLGQQQQQNIWSFGQQVQLWYEQGYTEQEAAIGAHSAP